MFAVSVEYDMNSDNFDLESLFITEDYVRNFYKCTSDGGAGFGFRDVTFYVEDEAKAWDVLFYLRTTLPPTSDNIYEVDCD